MEKLNIVRRNLPRIGSYLMAVILTILIAAYNVNKAIITIAMILIITLIVALIVEVSQIKISLSSTYVLKIIKTIVEGLLLILLCIACLFIVTLFSGYVSILLNGNFNIDTRSWLGFIGTFLSGMLGVFGGSLGVMIFSKAKIFNNHKEDQ